jgi:hypothetical protein
MPPKVFRLKKEKNVIFEEIYKCSLIEDNKEWKQLLNDMARNICPKGITVTENTTIKCNNSKKGNISYIFANKLPEENLKNIKELLKNFVNIDKNILIDFFKKVHQNTDEYIEWKKIRKKNIKEILLQNYSIDFSSKNSLCSKYVYRCFYNALFLDKTHTSNDIEFENNKIKNICDFEVENGILFNNREYVKESEKNKKKEIENVLHNLWEAYILTLYEKNIQQQD